MSSCTRCHSPLDADHIRVTSVLYTCTRVAVYLRLRVIPSSIAAESRETPPDRGRVKYQVHASPRSASANGAAKPNPARPDQRLRPYIDRSGGGPGVQTVRPRTFQTPPRRDGFSVPKPRTAPVRRADVWGASPMYVIDAEHRQFRCNSCNEATVDETGELCGPCARRALSTRHTAPRSNDSQ